MASFDNLSDAIRLGPLKCFYSFTGGKVCGRELLQDNIDVDSIFTEISRTPSKGVIRTWLCNRHQSAGDIDKLLDRVRYWQMEQTAASEALLTTESTCEDDAKAEDETEKPSEEEDDDTGTSNGESVFGTDLSGRSTPVLLSRAKRPSLRHGGRTSATGSTQNGSCPSTPGTTLSPEPSTPKAPSSSRSTTRSGKLIRSPSPPSPLPFSTPKHQRAVSPEIQSQAWSTNKQLERPVPKLDDEAPFHTPPSSLRKKPVQTSPTGSSTKQQEVTPPEKPLVRSSASDSQLLPKHSVISVPITTQRKDRAETEPPLPSQNEADESLEGDELRSSFTTHMIDDFIRSELQYPLPKAQTGNIKPGYVYIFRDRERQGHLKVGMTGGTITSRCQALETGCRRPLEEVPLDAEYDIDLYPVALYKRAEKLVHAELKHRQRKFKCPKCLSKHGEWFEVSEEIAMQTIQRWIRFMRENPYDEEGVLKPIWAERLNKTPRPRIAEELENYESRHQRWSVFVFTRQMDLWRWHAKLFMNQPKLVKWKAGCWVLLRVVFMLTFRTWAFAMSEVLSLYVLWHAILG